MILRLKGGAGSGRYPAGQHPSFDSYQNNTDLIDRQRFAEGLKTAVRHDITGNVTTGTSHKEAFYNSEANNPGQPNGWGNVTMGFQDMAGQFHTREEVENKINVPGESYQLSRFAAGEDWMINGPDKGVMYRDLPERFRKGGPGSGRYPLGSGEEKLSDKVIFEVAPNPDNTPAMDKWNTLSDQEKFNRSETVAHSYIPQILAKYGVTKEDIKTQYGSFEDGTTASFSLEMPEGIPPEALTDSTKSLGYNLSQKSMIAIGKEPFGDSGPVDAISIDIPEKFSLSSAGELYTGLRGIENNGKKAVGGATTVGRTMTILNFPEDEGKPPIMETAQLAEAIKTHLATLGPDYANAAIHTSPVHAWFPQEKVYANYNNAPQAGGDVGHGSVQNAPRDFRREITEAVTKVLEIALRKRQVIQTSRSREPLAKKSFAVRLILKQRKPEHPVGLAFKALGKKYEPQVASAFVQACSRIKNQIDMTELTEAVKSGNHHKVLELVLGGPSTDNRFRKELEGQFKTLIFEAYHAGGVIGASQIHRPVRGQPVAKGGAEYAATRAQGFYENPDQNQVITVWEY